MIESDKPRVVAAQIYIGGAIQSELAPGEEQLVAPLNFFSSKMFKAHLFKPKLFLGEPT